MFFDLSKVLQIKPSCSIDVFSLEFNFERDLEIKETYGAPDVLVLKYSSKYSLNEDAKKSYIYEKTFATLQDFKDEELEKYKLASLKIQAVMCDSNIGYAYIYKDKLSFKELSGLSNIYIKDLGEAGDDILSSEISYDCPFSANN